VKATDDESVGPFAAQMCYVREVVVKRQVKAVLIIIFITVCRWST
jgi:hypothetical protein